MNNDVLSHLIRCHTLAYLRQKSLLRNKARWDYLTEDDLPLEPVDRDISAIGEDGQEIIMIAPQSHQELQGLKSVLIPIFEIASMPERPQNLVEGKSDLEVAQYIVGPLTDSLVEAENRCYYKMDGYDGQLVVKVQYDLRVIPAHDEKMERIGFSVFESIGVAKV